MIPLLPIRHQASWQIITPEGNTIYAWDTEEAEKWRRRGAKVRIHVPRKGD